jgi:hypothetical protein
VTYAPKWERLSNAVDRVTKSTSLSREQTETDVCRAISDGAIGVRAKLARHATSLQTSQLVVGGDHLHIPTQLKPRDLDWQHSRPINPWLIDDLPRHRSGLWHLEWIELSKGDMTRELLPSEKAIAPADLKALGKKKKKRSTPKRDAARAAAKALYPKGIPAHVLDKQLGGQVVEYVKKNNRLDISGDTVLRAVGRRK